MMPDWSYSLAALAYLGCAILFILAIRGLNTPSSARSGLWCGILGMGAAIAVAIAMVAPHLAADPASGILVLLALAAGAGIGVWLALRTLMTAMPQLVATFNGLGGLASFLIALSVSLSPASFGLVGAGDRVALHSLAEIALSVLIGAVTFSGSVVAALKLQGLMRARPVLLPLRGWINAALLLAALLFLLLFALTGAFHYLLVLALLALFAGVLLVIPIGGADMPVVISMLNSYSGWAAAALGFTLSNLALIIVGAIVGASGSILSYIMCKAMNRSFLAVLIGGVGKDDAAAENTIADERPVRRGSAEDGAFILKNASKVIIVPGYGMAVAQAQHAVKDMADALQALGVDVSYAIHPVAGRMPGHMNVLLAEANVPYDHVFAIDDINPSFRRADVAFVVGANDVTNPAAVDTPSSPIFGMPVLEVWNARLTMFVKRSLGTGYSGVDNTLFYRDDTMMLLGDGRRMIEGIVKAI